MLDKQPLSYRTSFDQTALEYDAVRPGYPPALIEDSVTITGLPSPARILEIGCGTGQATLPFAERGDRLTCLDIGAEMLAGARPKFVDCDPTTPQTTCVRRPAPTPQPTPHTSPPPSSRP